MANKSFDTIAFVSKNGDSGVLELYDVIKNVTKEYKRASNRPLKRVISKLGIVQTKIFYGETYIEKVRMDGDLLYVHTFSERCISLTDIEIIAYAFNLEYYIRTVLLDDGLYFNNDVYGRVFPKTHLFEFKGKLKEIDKHFENTDDAIMLMNSGVVCSDVAEIFEYFREVFDIIIPFEVLCNDNRLEDYMARRKWSCTVLKRDSNIVEEELENIKGSIDLKRKKSVE